VVAGLHHLNKPEQHSMAVAVEKIRIHEKYAGVENDIALMKLSQLLDMSNNYIEGVCLPKRNQDFGEGTPSLVSGWGKLKESGPLSETLQVVVVPIMSDQTCAKYYKGQIEDTMICAGLAEGGKDACQGDSGGPHIVFQDGRALLVGVVSWGRGCAREGAPGVYTEVSKYLDWIANNAN